MSPLVAMRVAWLMAEVVTPSSAARSARGRMDSSGCSRLALVVTLLRPGNAAHLALDVQRGAGERGLRVVAGELDLQRTTAGIALAAATGCDADAGDGAQVLRSSSAAAAAATVRAHCARHSVTNVLALRGLSVMVTCTTSL